MSLSNCFNGYNAVRVVIAFLLIAGPTTRLEADTAGSNNGLIPSWTLPESRQSSATATSPGEVDLSSEARVVSAYNEDLLAFIQGIEALKQQPPISQADADAARADAWILEERVPQVVQAISGAIRKLRDAGVWDQVDEFIYARIHDDQLRRLMERGGGPRVRLENSVTEIPDLASPFFRDTISEIDSITRTARADSIITRQPFGFGFSLVRAGYNPTASARVSGFACVNMDKYILMKLINEETVSKEFLNRYKDCPLPD
jgi:hypothetical protein